MKINGIYLAGPITGLTFDEGRSWRTDVADLLLSYNVRALDPLRNKEFLRQCGTLTDNHRWHPLSSDSGVTTRDRDDVMRSGCILMNLLGATRISQGTMIEVGWADAYRVPIVLVMEDEGNVHEHCMLRNIAGYRTPDLAQATMIAMSLLGVNLNSACLDDLLWSKLRTAKEALT